MQQIDAALSEEAITLAVMPRYHVFNSVKRELGSKLGKLAANVAAGQPAGSTVVLPR